MSKKTEQKKKYLVKAPVKNYCGIGAGDVQFAYGKAEVKEGWLLDWYREHGYAVEEAAPESVKDAEVADSSK
ncbi:MAG: hypothetical protein RR219_08465 [Clostridiales bacterium]